MNPAAEFAEQLIRQVLDDLGGVLLEGDVPVAEPLALLAGAAAAGGSRGGTLILLAAAALHAHDALMDGWSESFDPPPAAAGALLREVFKLPDSRLPALYQAARNIEHAIAAAEPGARPPQQTLALAIHRLYEGLRKEDEALSGRGLVELRALVVHLDAVAGLLDQAGAGAAPLRVIRPDRFHDYFLRFTSLAQAQGQAGEERAVAALSRDGRIEALITGDAEHPIAAAARQVHEAVAGDAVTKDHVLTRIRALLVFLAALRRQPRAAVGDALADPNVQLSLVIAAATAPLRLGEEFGFTPLAQVARYNQVLLRGSQGLAHRPH